MAFWQKISTTPSIWKHRRIKSSMIPLGDRVSGSCVFSSPAAKKVGHQYVKRLTDTWQVSLSGSTLLCSAHLKNPGEASCPWVESHCGQPAPQVPCHPVLSWTVPPGWSLCCGRDVSLYVCLFLNFSVYTPPLSTDRVWSWADLPPLYLTGAN